MVLESNTLDFLFLNDGEKGVPGEKGDDGKTLYTWIKYSQYSDGTNMTDDPDGAIYIGLAYNKESIIESTNPSDYSWSKIKGSDAYTIVLTNENISFATDKDRNPLSNQSHTCEVVVLKGTEVRTDFTIGTIESVAGISTSVSNRIITLSTNTSTAIASDSGKISIPITIDGTEFSKVITFSVSKQGIKGENGIDSKSLDLYSSSYTVAFDADDNLKDSTNIILTANQQNYSDSIVWSTNPSVTLGTVDNNTNQRTLSPSLFRNNNKIQITITSGDLSDFVTIVKVRDGDKGENGKDAYTIILSNESHTFVGDTNAALNSTTKCEVIAFKGTTQVPSTIGNITGLPTGMTAPISNNGTESAYFSPTVTTSMTSKSGTLTIPITVDGVLFTKYFSYALALKGDAGTNGISVSSVEVYYYLSTSSTELIGGSWSTERPTWVDGKYIWSKQKTTLSNGSSSETDPVCITGGTGATGDTGRGVESITTEYYLSTSKTEQIGGEWSENQPEWSSGHYVWTRSKIVYSNPTSVEYTSPVCDTTWEAMQAQIDTVTKTISDVEVKVDKNTKSITEKVWQSDITNSINNYDGSTAQAIRDRVSKTETDISGITSTVSDIQISVSKKADGSTVTELQKTVTENKQDADSFKQTVEETYATKDSLNDYATTSQVSSAIEQKANIILGTVTDSEGNTTTYQGTLAGLASQVKDNENRMTQIEQTSEEISLKAGTAQKLAIESKTLSVNLSVETMTVATDTEGNNGSYSNCKTSIRVMYGIEDVTSDVSITCAPSDGIEYSINLQDKTCSITNMTYDNGYVDISASYIVTIDGVEKTLIDTSRFSVSKSKQGNVGAAGESVSVVSNVVLYQRSPNGTEIPTGEWNEEIQERDTGIYVSNHIDSNGVLVYSDGATLNGDGVLVVNDTNKQSNTYITTDGILISQDTTQDLKYLWTKTITTYSDGNECISYTVSSDGDTGNGISSSEVTYQVSSDGTNPPTGEWTSEIPAVGEGEYLWTKTVTSYTNGTTSTSYSVGGRGEQGVSVVSVTPEYYLSTSETEVIGGSWTETPPVKTSTTYIWKREHTVFDDNTEAYSSAVLDASLNKLFEVTAELTVSQEEITAEIKDAKGSSTTLKARLEGIDASVVDAEANAKSFATQEADRIQSTVTQEYKGYVDGIKYGVRNLLRDSANLTKWKAETGIIVSKENEWFKITDSSHTSSYYGIYSQVSDYEQNTDYTVSVDVKYGNCKAGLYIGYGSFGSLRRSISEEGSQRFEYTFNTGSNTKAIRVYLAIHPTAANCYGYFRLPKLEKGNRATDWTPAPEDIESTVSTVESNISQRADSIEMTVSKKVDTSFSKIRYVRDWLNGNSIDNTNYWLNCEISGGNVNYASGITPKGYNGLDSLATVEVTNPSYYTDNSFIDSEERDLTRYTSISSNDWCCLQLDLGDIKSVDYIRIWHYYADEREYNHKLQISQDGSNWQTLYDSEVQGRYTESNSGKTYILNEAYITEAFSQIRQDINGINLTVSNMSEENADDAWESAVASLEGRVGDTENAISNETKERSDAIESLNKQYSNIEIQLNNIKSTVQTINDDYAKKSEVTQTDEQWKVHLAKVGLYSGNDVEHQETNFTISEQGAILDNGKGQEIRMVANDDANGLFGYYNGNVIFKVTQDLTMTERILVNNGADFTTIKYVPRTYNGVGCLMHVKSGGTS